MKNDEVTSLASQKVLVIENDLFFTSRITEILKQVGLSSVLAFKPNEIAKLFKESDITLVILDLSMEGLDTLTFLNRLKSDPKTCDIPVIAFAEHTQKDLLQGARDLGCDIVVNNRGLVNDLKDLVLAALPQEITAEPGN